MSDPEVVQYACDSLAWSVIWFVIGILSTVTMQALIRYWSAK